MGIYEENCNYVYQTHFGLIDTGSEVQQLFQIRLESMVLFFKKISVASMIFYIVLLKILFLNCIYI